MEDIFQGRANRSLQWQRHRRPEHTRKGCPVCRCWKDTSRKAPNLVRSSPTRYLFKYGPEGCANLLPPSTSWSVPTSLISGHISSFPSMPLPSSLHLTSHYLLLYVSHNFSLITLLFSSDNNNTMLTLSRPPHRTLCRPPRNPKDPTQTNNPPRSKQPPSPNQPPPPL